MLRFKQSFTATEHNNTNMIYQKNEVLITKFKRCV